MAKRRKKTRRAESTRTERLRLTNAEPDKDDLERAAILAQLPAWARLFRTRSGFVVGAALVGGVIAYNALGRVAGPAVAGILLVGAGLALWRADVLERRARLEST